MFSFFWYFDISKLYIKNVSAFKIAMSEFVVTQWNCKTRTHGLLSASVFFTYFCFVSQNKIVTQTLNKKKTKTKKTKATQNENDYLQLGSRRHQWRKETKKASLYHVSWQICTYFLLSLSLSLFTKYIYHLHCTVLIGHSEVCKKTKQERNSGKQNLTL